MFIIINDKTYEARHWEQAATEAGMVGCVIIVGRTVETMTKQLRELFEENDEYFEGTILDFLFNSQTARDLLESLSANELIRLGRIVLVTGKGGDPDVSILSRQYCGGRLIESMVKRDRVNKLNEFFVNPLSFEERLRLLEENINTLDSRLRRIGG